MSLLSKNLSGLKSLAHVSSRNCTSRNLVRLQLLYYNECKDLRNLPMASFSDLPAKRQRFQFSSRGRRIRSRSSLPALRVPSPPTQPLDESHPTSLGVTAAVSPSLTGRNSVLWTV